METESTTNWESLFEELVKAENEIIKAINYLNDAAITSKFIKTGYKPDEWRNLHNLVSKSGKAIEKVNWYVQIPLTPSYPSYILDMNFTEDLFLQGI